MRPAQFTVTAGHVHHYASQLLLQHLRLRDHGPRCTAAVLVAVLLWAASCLRSLAAACASLCRAPSDQAVRNALAATLPPLLELQRRLNRALQGGLPKALRRRAQHVAFDLTLLPYYGLPAHSPNELYKGACKAGTRTFHAYATAYVIFRGCRLTLALRAVHHADPWDEVVKDLLRQVRQCGVKVRLLLLDRGFYSVSVIRYLQAARCPFLMPMIRRGRKPSHPRGPSGTWELAARKRSGWTTHRLEDKRSGRSATVGVCICRVRPQPPRGRRTKLRKAQTWLYAYWGWRPRTVRVVRETYRQRFGIESSYRQLHEARARTSSRSPQLRLLLVGVALLLRNVYVWLHWEVLSLRRRGRRVVDLDQLPLGAVLGWLRQAVEALLGLRTERTTQRPLPEELASAGAAAATPPPL